MFTIGEFSKITGLTVKTLRFYHEEGLLEPTCVDDQSGYRYYDSSKVEAARVIAFLRSLEFSVAEARSRLAVECKQGLTALGPRQAPQPAPSIDPERDRKLRALGYAE